MGVLFVVTLWAFPFAVYVAITAWDGWQQARWEYEELQRQHSQSVGSGVDG